MSSSAWGWTGPLSRADAKAVLLEDAHETGLTFAGGNGVITMQAGKCEVSVEHTTVRCTGSSPAGAGRSLWWAAQVEGQQSRATAGQLGKGSSRFQRPIIEEITVRRPDSSGLMQVASTADTRGGNLAQVIFRGSALGHRSAALDMIALAPSESFRSSFF